MISVEDWVEISRCVGPPISEVKRRPVESMGVLAVATCQTRVNWSGLVRCLRGSAPARGGRRVAGGCCRHLDAHCTPS